MLDFQVSTIVFTVINLLVLYFILRKLLFGRVNAVLEQRAARVKETIDSAEASKSQAEELRAEYEDKLTDARQEAAKLVADAQNRGAERGGLPGPAGRRQGGPAAHGGRRPGAGGLLPGGSG